MSDNKNLSVFKMGEPLPEMFSKYFIGNAHLNMLTTEGVSIGNVGYYQVWGEEARELKAGDVVNIPAEVKHWHGAAADSWFCHLAIEIPAEGASNEWLEAVSDEIYCKLK